ncbi:secreted RxLR effector protein 161-like [Cicer arietinum]|uniref:secreted RxLR effector protein 161-like n=1 Tax=Cicer arietinum TaxID=3827 RepID=UPI003CC6D055
MPDLAFAVNLVSRFMTDPGALHWSALKWIMRYLNGSLTTCLKFKKTCHDKEPIKGYVDSDYIGNMGTRKSIYGYVFTLYGTDVSWRAITHSVVTISTTQAEFIALTEGVKEVRWMK